MDMLKNDCTLCDCCIYKEMMEMRVNEMFMSIQGKDRGRDDNVYLSAWLGVT